MDVSSVQKTRLTFALISTPMLLAQHNILAKQIFSDEVICALKSWNGLLTIVVFAPLVGITVMHALRALYEAQRYRLEDLAKSYDIPLIDSGIRSKSAAKNFLLAAKILADRHELNGDYNFSALVGEIDNKVDQITHAMDLPQSDKENEILRAMQRLDGEIKKIPKSIYNNDELARELVDTSHSNARQYSIFYKKSKEIRIRYGRIALAGNWLSEIAYPIIVWLVLLWPLLIRPTLEAISRGTPLPFI